MMVRKIAKTFSDKFILFVNKIIPFKNYTILDYEGRLGNNLQQILNGIIYSKINSANFYSSSHQYIKKIKIVNNEFHDKFRIFKKKYQFFALESPSRNEILPMKFMNSNFYIENANYYMKENVSKKIKFLEEKKINEDTLVIHIRSGEIFNGKNKYPDYVQNPLKFYEILIDKFEKVLIVSENKNNPVISHLLKNNKVNFQSSTLENDFNTLYSAQNLATSGVGTFGISAGLMSKKLKNFYCTNIFCDFHINPKMLDKSNINIFMFEIENYIQIGEWVGNKKNIDLMLSKNIKIKTPKNYE